MPSMGIYVYLCSLFRDTFMPNNRLIKGDGVPFTQISNEVLNDDRLSLKAKGLYCYMYSKPDSWNFTAKLIATQNRDSRDAVLSGMKELTAAGLLSYQKHSDGSGTYTLYLYPTRPETDEAEEVLEDGPGRDLTQNRKIPPWRFPTVGKSGRISNKDLSSNKDLLSNPVKSAGCRLKISEEVRAFKDRLYHHDHVGKIGRIYVEGVMEDIYIGEDRKLYTSTRSPNQLVSSTIAEIYTQLHNLNEMKKRAIPERAMG